MSFQKIVCVKNKIKLMEKIGEQRAKIKQDFLDERLGKTDLEENLSKFFKPITKAVEKDEKTVDEDLKKQNKLLENEVDTLKQIVKYNEKKSILDFTNLDNDLNDKDKKILEEQELPLPSVIFTKNLNLDKIVNNVRDVYEAMTIDYDKAGNRQKEYLDKLKGTIPKYLNILGKMSKLKFEQKPNLPQLPKDIPPETKNEYPIVEIVIDDNKFNDTEKQFLKNYKLSLPSQIYSENLPADDMIKTVEVMSKNAKKINKKFGALKRYNKVDKSGLTGEECVDTIRKYVNEITDLSQALKAKTKYVKQIRRKSQINQQLTTLKQGDGLKRNKNYLTIQDGKFGKLKINTTKLISGKLEVYDGRKKIMSKKIDKDLYDLLTRRINKKRQYSNDAISTFNKLLDLSGIKSMNSLSNKSKMDVIYYNDPNELINELNLLISSKKLVILDWIIKLIQYLINY